MGGSIIGIGSTGINDDNHIASGGSMEGVGSDKMNDNKTVEAMKVS